MSKLIAVLSILLLPSWVCSAVDIEVFTDTGMVPYTVLFTAKASTPVAGEITRYDWDFNDSNADYDETDEGRLVGHRFDTAGDYTVNLTVTDSAGNAQTGLQVIHVVAVPVDAVTFYVAANGNDENNGTSPISPFLTIGRASAAVAASPGGSQMLLRRGDSFPVGTGWNLSSPDILRTGPYFYRIGSYGTGSRPIVTRTGTGNVITMDPPEGRGFVLEDVDIAGGIVVSSWYYSASQPTGFRYPGTRAIIRNVGAVSFGGWQLHGHTIENLTLTQPAGNDSQCWGVDQGIGFFYMTRSEWSGADGHGAYIATAGEDILLEKNAIHHNGVANGRDGITIHGVFDNVTLRGNDIHHNGWALGLDAGYNSAVAETMSNFFVEGNRIHSQVNYTTQLSSLQHSMIRDNLFYDNPPGRATIYFEDNNSTGVDIPSNDVRILNNTFLRATSGVLSINEVGSDNIQFKNNIVSEYTAASLVDTINAGNVEFSNNLYHNIAGTFLIGGVSRDIVTWLASGLDPGSLNADPLFTNSSLSDFTLQPSSPAINAGATVGVAYDFLGYLRNVGAIDIGAYEYGASGEGATITCYQDVDNDLYGHGTSESVESCSPGYYLSSHFMAMAGDCNDNAASIHPGATDTCGNGIDEDCSGTDAACGGGTAAHRGHRFGGSIGRISGQIIGGVQ